MTPTRDHNPTFRLPAISAAMGAMTAPVHPRHVMAVETAISAVAEATSAAAAVISAVAEATSAAEAVISVVAEATSAVAEEAKASAAGVRVVLVEAVEVDGVVCSAPHLWTSMK